MKIETNKEAVKLYISRDGAECLFCGESNLQGSRFNVEDGATRQEMHCPDCENSWVDSYHLAAVIHDGEVYDNLDESLNKLFRHFTSRNFVDVGEMMHELARYIGIKPTDEAKILKAEAERKRLNEVAFLEDIWKALRTEDYATASQVMEHLCSIINEKRGDSVVSSCGCSGNVGYYDGALGYEAMVCKSCGQHFHLLFKSGIDNVRSQNKDQWDCHIDGEHQFFLSEDWRAEVANKNTILGYQNWVEHSIETLLDRSILVGVDSIEVAGCTEVDGIVEVTEETEAEFYSVYTHRSNQGVECICDFNTKGQAVAFAKRLARLTDIPVYGNLCNLEVASE